MAEVSPLEPRLRVAEALSRLWWLPLLRGILFAILGCYALAQPIKMTAALAQVIAIFIIADGVFLIVAGIIGEVPSRGWTIARGVIEILVSCFVFANAYLFTMVGGVMLISMLAFAAIFTGILEIIAAISDRKEIEGEGWIILGGVLSVIFGGILLSKPLTSGVILVQVLGIFAIFSGVSMVFYAFRLRKLGKKLAEKGSIEES